MLRRLTLLPKGPQSRLRPRPRPRPGPVPVPNHNGSYQILKVELSLSAPARCSSFVPSGCVGTRIWLARSSRLVRPHPTAQTSLRPAPARPAPHCKVQGRGAKVIATSQPRNPFALCPDRGPLFQRLYPTRRRSWATVAHSLHLIPVAAYQRIRTSPCLFDHPQRLDCFDILTLRLRASSKGGAGRAVYNGS